MSAVRDAFNRQAYRYNSVSALQAKIAFCLDERLNLLTPNTSTIVDLGAGTGLMTQFLDQRFKPKHFFIVDIAEQSLKINQQKHRNTQSICANANALPFADNSVDLLVSNLMLQWCGDLAKTLSECQRVLKNDGLFIFTSFGADTLNELKSSWKFVDNSCHVNDFIAMETMSYALLNCGLQNPILETEQLTLTYDTVQDLMYDLKNLGANTVPNRRAGLTGKTQFQAMLNQYETFRNQGKLPATYEVIYGHAWQTFA